MQGHILLVGVGVSHRPWEGRIATSWAQLRTLRSGEEEAPAPASTGRAAFPSPGGQPAPEAVRPGGHQRGCGSAASWVGQALVVRLCQAQQRTDRP